MYCPSEMGSVLLDDKRADLAEREREEEFDLGDYMRVPELTDDSHGSIIHIPVAHNDAHLDVAPGLCFVLESNDATSCSSSEQTAVQSLPTQDLPKLTDVEVIVKEEREDAVAAFSSTPDLASKSPSNVSNCDSVTQGVRTPVVDEFIMELDKKLLELVNNGKENQEVWQLSNPENYYSGACSGYESYVSSCMGYSRSLTCTGTTTAQFSPRPPCPQSVLKRKRSAAMQESQNDGLRNDALESRIIDENEDRNQTAPPASKRAKPVPDTSFSYFAKEAASLRKSRSLTNDPSIDVPTNAISTVPASPGEESDYDAHSTNEADLDLEKRRQLIPFLPIIAPPPYHEIPRPPASPDDAAEARLRLLLEKEKTSRHFDGFENGVNDCFSGVSQEEIDQILGIDEDLRRSVVDWMLAVAPTKALRLPHLREHLRKCPETRFHAIMLFSRYFMRVGEEMPVAGKRETKLMKRGRQRIVWEVAMSCLALAVKFNRDFLRPLTPIHSRTFLAIAPYSMSHDDLEISQKDVLEVLSYQVREVTPGPFLEEIWNSLPTLRKLVAFPEGWPTVQQNAWRRLNTCATEGEMFQFPISLLTAAALIDGIIEALMTYYDAEEVGSKPCYDKSLETKATCAVAGVVDDVKDILGVKKASLISSSADGY
ncbi:hypothetical protein SCHPADRAFT_1003161 [Schizopora paradoxa]|uniref:Cyclin N-terminal domain-containing protein n=1 Tax=Schizopora paradoxa TaxID=27342 RepID=A0A0H2QZ79_9AGAM|nr:hypothetical protein SCHPADRAFT_1003161 [Schizopora paradoxa]